jgi:hypothetical protein
MTTIEKAKRILDPQKLNLPPRPIIEEIEVEEYADWEGEDALRVQIILAEDTTDADITGEAAIDIQTAIRDALLAEGIREFPYVFVAKRSELNTLEDAE